MRRAALITIEYPATCLTCEEQVKTEDRAWWIKSVGIWHEDCLPPRNLEAYIHESEQKKKLGL